MNEELRLHIKKLQNRAVLSLFAVLLAMISIGFGILSLFLPSLVAVLFFAIALFSILYLAYSSRRAKKEATDAVYKPVRFYADRPLSFEELVGIFENGTDKENQLSISEDVRFFLSKNIFKLRTILYRTADFNKKEFDAAKDRMNKKANNALNISHWVNRAEARKMMRFNMIYTHTASDVLDRFMSQNANRSLARVEGTINIAVVGNQIMIPPMYGECDLSEISRYKKVIQFVEQTLLHP